MANSLELLEEKFRQVEEASERRIVDKCELLQRELVNTSAQHIKCRNKPGVSVSQFGKREEQGDNGSHSQGSSPLSAMASKSTFYHTLANPRSVDSFVSDIPGEETRLGEEHLEIQVERISGRQAIPKTMGALLPRRLTRAQSQVDYVSVDKSMVIDVSVETTTESSHLSSDLQTSTVCATKSSRPRAVTIPPPQGGLVERAKDLARKLRRKSKAELP